VSNIIYCGNCGSANAVDAAFCVNCGTQLHSVTTTQRQPNVPQQTEAPQAPAAIPQRQTHTTPAATSSVSNQSTQRPVNPNYLTSAIVTPSAKTQRARKPKVTLFVGLGALVLGAVGGGFVWWQQQGDVSTSSLAVDETFSTNIGRGADDKVFSAAVQQDGRIIVGGDFSTWNGRLANRVVRVEANGSLDSSFASSIGLGANDGVRTIAVQEDGKVLVGGLFTNWDGSFAPRLVRLRDNGTLDTAFMRNLGSGADELVYNVRLQPDGKILVGGNFTLWNEVVVNRVVRLNSDGTVDTRFSGNIGDGAEDWVCSFALQSDGRIIVTGGFIELSNRTVNGVARLNSDGTRDLSFSASTGSGSDGWILTSRVLSDNSIILGGAFTTWNGSTVGRLVRLNADGTTDVQFQQATGNGADAQIYGIAEQADKKLILVGEFTLWNGTSVNRIVRLNPNGTLDESFKLDIGLAANDAAIDTVVGPDGSILVAGNFTTWNNLSANRVLRLIPS